MRGLKKIAWEGDNHTDTQTDIATTRKIWPTGRFFKSYRDYRTRRSTVNKEKSYASFNMSNGDINVDDAAENEN